ncbi:MAG: nucleotide exchange factor GrpE [Francisellaceae bacterium]
MSKDKQHKQEQMAEKEHLDIHDNDGKTLVTLQAEIDALKAKLVTADEEVSKANDQVLRAHAEMENIRRRAQMDVEKAHKYSLEKFANALLPVLDSMEQAIEYPAESAEGKAIAEGVSITLKMMIETLEKFGVVQINPENEPFDPNKHEAMAAVPHPELLDNHVMQVFQKGYELNERVVRPARVAVVKND